MQALRMLTLPAVLFFLGEAELGQDAVGEMGDDVVDGFGRVVEGGHGGHDGGTGVVDAEHVFEVDAVEGRFPEAEHQGAALFQADVGGAGKQIVGYAGGDGGERAGGARDDDHGVNGSAAGGDGGADVFVGQVFDFFCGRAGQERSEFFAVGRDDIQFGGDEAQTRFRDDEKDALDTRVGVEQTKHGLRVDCAAGSGDAYYDVGASGFCHGYKPNQRV